MVARSPDTLTSWLRRGWALWTLAALALWTSRPAQAKDTWTQPYKGIRHLHRQTSNQNINVLVIDLCTSGVSLRATASSERRRTVSSFGKHAGAQAAINGDFFSFRNYATNGLAMHSGAAWPGSKDHSYVAPIAIGSKRVEIPHHNNINKPLSWMKEVVSGHPTLLDNGNHVGNPNDPLCTARHPRTAVGLSKDHKTMIWAVVDGRASRRIGMTCRELSSLLRGLGAWDAVNMDGGGSSTMWVRSKGVVNRPSDGRERVVANHLAVKAIGSGAAAHCPCQPRCQGSKIIGSDCGVGDCAVFGATCVNDRLGVRCVSVLCPAIGKKKVCVNDKLIGDCNNGGIKTGDCSKFAAYCSTAGVSEARCVSAFCVSGPKEVPKAHPICLPDGRFGQCTSSGSVIKARECPKGEVCKIHNGVAQCLSKTFEPPPTREKPPVQEKPPAREKPPVQEKPPAETTAPEPNEDAGRPAESQGEPPSERVGETPAPFPDHSPPDPPVFPDASGGEILVLDPGGPLPPGGCGCTGATSPFFGGWWVVLLWLLAIVSRYTKSS